MKKQIFTKRIVGQCKDRKRNEKSVFYGSQNRGIYVPKTHGQFCPHLLPSVISQVTLCAYILLLGQEQNKHDITRFNLYTYPSSTPIRNRRHKTSEGECNWQVVGVGTACWWEVTARVGDHICVPKCVYISGSSNIAAKQKARLLWRNQRVAFVVKLHSRKE